MLTLLRTCAIVLIACYWSPLVVIAQDSDKTAVKPAVLSLPAGPGSVEGLGSSFQPRLNSGSFSYSVAVHLPSGAAGLTPTLNLIYDSAFGNSPFGQGWLLSGPLEIDREVEKGFPRYRDSALPSGGAALPDGFIFEGEELVPISDGTFRPRNEAYFRRFSRIQSAPNGPVDSWLVEDPNGVKHWLGRYQNDGMHGNSRVMDPLPPQDQLGTRTPFESTFLWLEDASEDLNGNRIEYAYSEGDASSSGILYLSEIRYFAKAAPTNYHRVRLFYEGRTDALDDNRAGFNRRIAFRCREIAITTVYGGAEHYIRSYVLSYDPGSGALSSGHDPSVQVENGISRLQAVSEFGADHVAGTGYGSGTPLPATRFAYSGFFLQRPSAATLSQLRPLGIRLRSGEADPLSAGPIERTISQIDSGNPGPPNPILDFDLSDPRVQIVDMNGDGLPDILDTNIDPSSNPNRLYRVSWNLTDDKFERTGFGFVDSNPPVDLSTSGKDLDVSLADLSGHGIVDLIEIQRAGGTSQSLVFRNQHNPGWASSKIGFGSAETSVAPPDISLSAPNVRTLDLNFDKKTDILVATANGLDGYIWTDAGWRSYMRRWPWSQQIGDGGIPREYQFSFVDQNGRDRENPLVQLADMNGDRLLDLVRVTVSVDGEVRISYLPMTGPMQWGKEVAIQFADATGAPTGIVGRFPMIGIKADANDPSNQWQSVKLIDVNGDGLTDIVFVQPNHLAQVYINCAGKAFRGPFAIHFQSDYQPTDALDPTTLRTADLNGNGSVDLVFFQKNRRSLTYLDFVAGQKAGLLQIIDNGIGGRSYLRYRPSTNDLSRSRLQHAPWSTTNPNPLWVLSAIIEEDGPFAASVPNAIFRVTTFDYRDGYYDPFEKQFRGFAFVQQIIWGDDVDPSTGLPSTNLLASSGTRTAVSRFRFHTGAPDMVDNDEYVPGVDDGTPPPSSVDEASDLAGREEEPLKGKLIWKELADGAVLTDLSADFDTCAAKVAQEIALGRGYGPAAMVCTPNRYVLTRTVQSWAIRRLYRPPGAIWPKGRLLADEPTNVTLNGMSVSFAVMRERTEESIEAVDLLRSAWPPSRGTLPTSPPVTVGTSFDYDNFGNTTRIQEEGITAGPQEFQRSSRVTRKSYILTRGSAGSINRWILDRETSQRLESGSGEFVNETRYFYDGPPFVGLPSNELGARALLTRVQRRVRDSAASFVPIQMVPSTDNQLTQMSVPGNSLTGSEWIDSERRAYDSYGNAITFLDPLATLTTTGSPDSIVGHYRVLEYDVIFHTSPTKESIFPGMNHAPIDFAASYERTETPNSSAVPLGFDTITQSIDPNGNTTDYLYDSFARLTAVVRPGDSEALPTVIYSYRPGDANRGQVYSYDRKGGLQIAAVSSSAVANAVEIDQRLIPGRQDLLTSIHYTDGHGRTLMSISSSGASGQFDVTNATIYGQTGHPTALLQPYRQVGASFQQPPSSSFRTEYSSDAANRVARILYPPETSAPPTVLRDSRTLYLPLCELRYDAEDLGATDQTNSHLETPLVVCSDGLGRRTSVRESLRDDATDKVRTLETTYRYDLNDRLISVRDSANNVQWSRYDGLGRSLFKNDPDRGAVTYNYDDASQLISQKDSAGHEIHWTYDGASRLLTAAYYGGQSLGRQPFDPGQPISSTNRPDIAYFYDDPSVGLTFADGSPASPTFTKGKLSHVWDGAGEEHISYDMRGRVVWRLRTLSLYGSSNATYLAKQAYDSADRISARILPDNTTVHYGYDLGGRIDQIDLDNGTSVLKHVDYSAAGLPFRTEYGNSVVTEREYDPRLRIVSIHSHLSTGPTLLSLHYSFDGVSNITKIDDDLTYQASADPLNKTVRLHYDDLYRLTDASYPRVPSSTQPNSVARIAFQYDNIGNLIRETADIPGAAPGASPNLGGIQYGASLGAAGRVGKVDSTPGPHAVTSAGTSSTIDYDSVGNIKHVDAMTLIWDAANHVIGLDSAQSHTEYLYDYSGRRVLKRTWDLTAGPAEQREPDTWTAYVSSEFEVTREAAKKHIWAGANRIATVVSGPESDMYWYHADQSGSTLLTTDNIGRPREQFSYYPYGATRSQANLGSDSNATTHYQFGGKEWDKESQFDYFGSRYYWPALGRFISPDEWPLSAESLANPQNWNRYSFVLNNPLSYMDPDGHEAVPAGSGEATFGSGFAATTYQPIVQIATHPINTLGALGNAVMHPADTAVALKNAVVETSKAAISGDRNAIGKVTGTVVSAVVLAGVGKAVSSLGQGVKISEAAVETTNVTRAVGAFDAAETTSLYRAVGSAEAESITKTGVFSASPTGSEFKGFFYGEADAQSFGSRMTQMTGDPHTVVSGEAPTGLVNSSPVHNAATEGPGVLIKNENLPQVRVKPPDQL